ncbi:Protein CYP-14A3 [Aphelenchoides avenae]|nr:Protein CYP-14A3 [Aphelenchus avenae]
MPEPHVVLSDFDAVKEALVIKGEHFIGKINDPFVEYMAFVPNGGVFPSEGENWRHQRRIALSILRDMGMGKDLMEERVLESARNLVKQIDGLESREDIDLFCIANVINHVVFGFKFDTLEDYAKFDKLLNNFVNGLMNLKATFGNSLPFAERWLPNVARARNAAFAQKDEYYDFITRQVEAQKRRFSRNEAPETFVQAYLHEMAKGTNPHYNRNQLISVASDMWFAGLMTTVVALRWSILCMTRYPDVQRKAQAEIDEVVGSDRLPSIADKSNLPYLNAVVQEILRYSNAAVFEPHRCTSDQTIKGLPVPKDTIVMPQFSNVNAFDPVFEDPEVFRPDRFLEDDGRSVNKVATSRMVAFEMGKRVCPGEALARMEVFLIVAALLQRYTFVRDGLHTVPPAAFFRDPGEYRCTIVPRVHLPA